MEFKTRYITADEFKQYFGIDLQIELPNGDNESGKVAAYLARIENRLEAWINANYFYNVTQFWETLNNNQKEQYKYALLEQAYYVLRMGDISVDSGYDKERGIIAGRSTINELSVAPNAMLHLENGGFLNTRIVKRGGYYQGGVANSQVVAGGVVGQKGEPGKDGLTPFIGDNGNWWIGGLDTGVTAAGLQGPQGPAGISAGWGVKYYNLDSLLPQTLSVGESKSYIVVADKLIASDEGLLTIGLQGFNGGGAPIALGTFEVGEVVVLSRYDESIWYVESRNSGGDYSPTGFPPQEFDITVVSDGYLMLVEMMY